ncbi:hypothetical protein [Latilactobacillus fuchuensis]|nr:hypothetical protein [Latilactobacillus fuchuensis]
MDKKAQKQEIKQTEAVIAKKLISEYQGINKIEFIADSYIGETGYEQFQFKINEGVLFGYDVGESAYDDNISNGLANGKNEIEQTILKSKNRRNKPLRLKEIDLSDYRIIYSLKSDG